MFSTLLAIITKRAALISECVLLCQPLLISVGAGDCRADLEIIASKVSCITVVNLQVMVFYKPMFTCDYTLLAIIGK